MDAPSLSSQSPSPDLGPQFDAASLTATASLVTSLCDPIFDTPECECRSPVLFVHRCDEWRRSGRLARRPRTTAIQIRQLRSGMRRTLFSSLGQPLPKRRFVFRKADEEVDLRLRVSLRACCEIEIQGKRETRERAAAAGPDENGYLANVCTVELVSLPDSLSGRPRLCDVVPESLRHFLENIRSMINNKAELENMQPSVLRTGAQCSREIVQNGRGSLHVCWRLDFFDLVRRGLRNMFLESSFSTRRARNRNV